LRLAVENGKPPQSFDFLSSLEVIILHQADVIYMQNMEHAQFILSKCNQLPEHDHDTDFSRIRPYFLNEKSMEHRQLIITTHFNDPKIQSLMREFGKSCAGNVRVKKQWGEGCVSLVTSKIHQVFQMIKPASFETDSDERFNYFRDKVLSQILRLDQKHTLIITPSYLDYVRIRNELLRQEASAVFVSEYSRDSEISRGRSRFFHGQKSILLYSGRSHFFRRFLIRGALHIIFYSIPEYPHFYNEIVNVLGSGLSETAKDTGMSCTVLTSKYEQIALERVVGTSRVEYMMTSKKSVFMFC
jgi:U3 small nucleolar RNA-associated protein 25